MHGFEKSARKLGVDQIDLVMATRHGLPRVLGVGTACCCWWSSC